MARVCCGSEKLVMFVNVSRIKFLLNVAQYL